eukprot:m.310008 g.310008  ORF g.310008 m.310008 type:complete len:1179 (+) comp49089_c0_seq1:111-3647(+)
MPPRKRVARLRPSTTSKRRKATRNDKEPNESNLDDSVETSQEKQSNEEEIGNLSLEKGGKKAIKRKSTASGSKKSPVKTKKNSRKAKLLDAVAGKTFDTIEVALFGWFDQFTESSDTAALDFIQFILESCGWKGELSMDEVNADNIETVIQTLMNGIVPGPYPILHNKLPHLSSFVKLFVHQCVAREMTDEFLHGVLLPWIVALTSSSCRAFRHTATFIGLSFVTALANALTEKEQTLSQHETQLSTEKGKAAKKISTQRVELLETQIEELNENVGSIMEIVQEVATQILKHRSKDIRSEIRLTAIAELGEWMVNCKTEFLQDKYLRYLGWALYDKSGDVRQQTVASLVNVFEDQEDFSSLSAFTERFKNRIVEMTRDVDGRVTAEAFKLLDQLVTMNVLEESDLQEVSRLMFCVTQPRSHAAGKFFCSVFLSDEKIESWKTEFSPGGCGDDEARLRSLLTWCEDFHGETPVEYFVDAIWNQTPVLSNWKAMTDLLLKGGGSDLEGPQEEILAEMMRVAVWRATGGDPPKGRTPPKKKGYKSAVERKFADGKVAVSKHFMRTLPDLLDKFAADDEILQNLFAIPCCFDVSLYSELDLGWAQDKLMAHIKRALTQTTSREVLKNSAETMAAFLDPDLATHLPAINFLDLVADDIAEQFRKTLANEGCGASLLPEVRRVCTLLKHLDLSKLYLFDEMNQILDDHLAPGEMCEDALFSLNYALTWIIVEGNLANREVLDLVKENTEWLSSHCTKILKSKLQEEEEETGEEDASHLPAKAFLALVDYIAIYEKRMKNKRPGDVSFCDDLSLERILLNFVERFCFGESVNPKPLSEMNEEEAELRSLQWEVLGGLLRLQLSGILSMNALTSVLIHFHQPYADVYGSLFKSLGVHVKEIYPRSYFKLILRTVQTAFEKEPKNRRKQTELGSNLAAFFGDGMKLRQMEVREQIIWFHRHCIDYALSDMPEDPMEEAPTHLPFLHVAGMFTSKLLPVDKSGAKGVLPYLDEKLPAEEAIADLTLHHWNPLRDYRVLLGAKETDISEMKKTPVQRKKAPSRKKGKVARLGNADTPEIGAQRKRRGYKRGGKPTGGREKRAKKILAKERLEGEESPIKEALVEDDEQEDIDHLGDLAEEEEKEEMEEIVFDDEDILPTPRDLGSDLIQVGASKIVTDESPTWDISSAM